MVKLTKKEISFQFQTEDLSVWSPVLQSLDVTLQIYHCVHQYLVLYELIPLVKESKITFTLIHEYFSYLPTSLVDHCAAVTDWSVILQ